MTAENLSMLAATVLSLVCSYVPGVKQWFDALQSQYKQAVMGGLLLLVAAAVFGLGCAGLVDGVTCSEAGLWQFAQVFFSALIANQSVYHITRRA